MGAGWGLLGGARLFLEWRRGLVLERSTVFSSLSRFEKR